MSVFFYLLFLFIHFVQNNKIDRYNILKNISKDINKTYNIDNIKNENSIPNKKRKRNLNTEYTPIKILVDTSQLELDLKILRKTYILSNFKEAINRALEILSDLISVEKSEQGINISDITDTEYESDFGYLADYKNTTLFEGYQPYDLIIFTRNSFPDEKYEEKNIFAKPKIMRTGLNGRPIVGSIVFNIYYANNTDNTTKTNIYTSIMLHEMFHILGFMDQLFLTFKQKENIFGYEHEKRLNLQTNKKVVRSENIINLAKKYFGDNNIQYLELEINDDIEGLNNSHWEGRILLGDIMTSNMYLQEQVISDFTLALLEESGWYKINHYTGGLMRFGKNKTKSFLDNDCFENGKPLFNNEFCYQPYGTCSSGRLSKGFCNTTINNRIDSIYNRKGISNTLNGEKNVEYCPTSSSKFSDDEFLISNCKFENKNYYSLLFNSNTNFDYNILSDKFLEKYGDTSFCVLSSVLEKSDSDSNEIYKGLVRPTCYSMICGKKSLTIELNSEYIVCPREGGMIKIGKGNNLTYTQYLGYIFCPDYNLICTGSTVCNNLYDCVKKKSSSITLNYDYKINNVLNAITTSITNDSLLDTLTPNEGYELSDDDESKCPVNCSQCISNKRCILCRNFTKKEPHAYYIGEVDNENNYINCSEFKPEGGYYNINRSSHMHFFRCIENCNVCEDAKDCFQCLPEYKIDNKK